MMHRNAFGKNTDGEENKRKKTNNSEHGSSQKNGRKQVTDKSDNYFSKKAFADKPAKSGSSNDRPKRYPKPNTAEQQASHKRPAASRFSNDGEKTWKNTERPLNKANNNKKTEHKSQPYNTAKLGEDIRKPDRVRREKDSNEAGRAEKKTQAQSPMPLNKYIAHSGECSRRDAAELVRQGKVNVNGEVITDPGHKVTLADKIMLSGKKLTPTKDLVYILLNKPKGFITTTEDPEGRKTVMDLVANANIDRLYPVGRLDRNTTGLLLLTNDGDLAQKLSHPSYEIKKIYQVSLNKALTAADFEKIVQGVQLDDGMARVDAIAYLDEKTEIGLEIHSGKNRIVRRIFEALGYEVEKLDRVMYAGLTKKNLPRSKWRFLTEREVVLLKHFKR